MVFAYALLGVPVFREDALAVLETATEIHVPDSFRAELVNVVWQWVQYKDVPLDVGLDVLRDAEALAEFTDTKLVTYDTELRQAFPDRAISPAEFLA